MKKKKKRFFLEIYQFAQKQQKTRRRPEFFFGLGVEFKLLPPPLLGDIWSSAGREAAGRNFCKFWCFQGNICGENIKLSAFPPS